MRVAIAGATGYVGGRLAPRLVEAGHEVRCLARAPGKLTWREWASRPGVEIKETQLDDQASVAAALAGCDAAYYLVHSLASAGADYANRDRDLALTFAQAAKQAGLPRIIYLGGLGETGANLSEHLASRREVERALSSTGVPVTVLRAAMIIGSGSASFEILRYLVDRLPVMITPKWVSTRCQPIAIRNVITYLVGCLEVNATIGRTFDIGGREVMRYRDIIQVMAEEMKLPRRWIIPVPVMSTALSSYWIGFVTPLSSRIARPLAEGLRNPVVCRESRIERLIPQDLMDVRESIALALVRLATDRVETSWSMAGPIPGDPDWAGGQVFRDEREMKVDAPAAAVFQAVCHLGGQHGWYSANALWKLRGWLDQVAGGPGLRRGRLHPLQTGYGEALDFWRVVGFEADRRLSLRSEMKMPGEAVLEFVIEKAEAGHCLLKQAALFQPRGLPGLAYWYLVFPFHAIVFQGMLRGIRDAAVNASRTEPLRRAGTTIAEERLAAGSSGRS